MNKITKYAVAWAELNENSKPTAHFACGTLGVYNTREDARDAIDDCIYDDICRELEHYDKDDLPEELNKSEEDIAKDWITLDNGDTVEVECFNGLQCIYQISEVKVNI